jgi:hypothetical protein
LRPVRDDLVAVESAGFIESQRYRGKEDQQIAHGGIWFSQEQRHCFTWVHGRIVAWCLIGGNLEPSARVAVNGTFGDCVIHRGRERRNGSADRRGPQPRLPKSDYEGLKVRAADAIERRAL